jgi:hypothetical protein
MKRLLPGEHDARLGVHRRALVAALATLTTLAHDDREAACHQEQTDPEAPPQIKAGEGKRFCRRSRCRRSWFRGGCRFFFRRRRFFRRRGARARLVWFLVVAGARVRFRSGDGRSRREQSHRHQQHDREDGEPAQDAGSSPDGRCAYCPWPARGHDIGPSHANLHLVVWWVFRRPKWSSFSAGLGDSDRKALRLCSPFAGLGLHVRRNVYQLSRSTSGSQVPISPQTAGQTTGLCDLGAAFEPSFGQLAAQHLLVELAHAGLGDLPDEGKLVGKPEFRHPRAQVLDELVGTGAT